MTRFPDLEVRTLDFLLLTKSTTFIIGPIATLLGYIMDGIYRIGVHNVAWCIIIFTVIVNILLLPLTIKQQKFMKLNSIMQPELMAIQKKYKDKKDQASVQKAQLEQLKAYISENSKDMPVIITGDMNIAMHCDINAEFYPVMIENGGFKDAWSEYCNDGVYFTSRLSPEVNAEYEARFGGNYWGRWDSVERVVYRSSSNVELTPTDFRYEDYNNRDGHGVVTDHSVMICEMEVATTDYVAPAIDLNKEKRELFGHKLVRTVKLTSRCIYRILTDLIAKIKSGEITIK